MSTPQRSISRSSADMASHILKKSASMQSTGTASGETSLKVETVMNETVISRVTETPVSSEYTTPQEMEEPNPTQTEPPEGPVFPTTPVNEQFNSMTSEDVVTAPFSSGPIPAAVDRTLQAPITPATAVPNVQEIAPSQGVSVSAVPTQFHSNDPREKFNHLTPEDYVKIFNCTKEEFDAKKPWQKERERKSHHLW
jgi:Villin headpiece domain